MAGEKPPLPIISRRDPGEIRNTTSSEVVSKKYGADAFYAAAPSFIFRLKNKH